ncbi:hypothetical protein [Pseudoalteromonas sp. S16_S37]|uniref:hypothetical protein n=1 Tax=Pseudoalteromonas sp. S16_S37 TaxID=2720228 RepID=UPI0016818A05|nr:hypothetical protein [Pseudoalteromonas sp. S16_S37]MBD1580972.1 hypothetical protein [Pseudoalteromonas sp. S16_S37]
MSKGYFYLALLMLSLFALDALSRLNINVDIDSKPFLLGDSTTGVFPLLSNESRDLIQKTLTNLAAPENNSEPNAQPGMSLAEQAKQTGELTTVFAQDKKLKLKAVVQSSSSAYALLEIAQIKGGASKLKRFNQGANIEGYTLNIISSTKVELRKNAQLITLIMYQSTKQ